MEKNLQKIIKGYQIFREKYASGDSSIMYNLYREGQQPAILVIACCDARVDPALILQCDPGDLFVVRNVANIVPPYEKDKTHHGTSAALEFGICLLQVQHLIILGHSQCGGIKAFLSKKESKQDDFITNWIALLPALPSLPCSSDAYAKLSLNQSYANCLTFPWIQEKVLKQQLTIHRWFFDIPTGSIYTYHAVQDAYVPLA
ncbi:carbonic anhydrase [Candidatus Cardinium hertigii]|uniref:Carbonic anhydrase n=1 Tax=Candidatus Cardinium hertigii TaxID=247481 RepID=A0A2Z3LGE8_9BACT|nr:carbonic anhydrase [Candidatus Cardinium hertigii]AWN81454.1 Carbonic anhydrase [Candidatus Cardinium hertigii]